MLTDDAAMYIINEGVISKANVMSLLPEKYELTVIAKKVQDVKNYHSCISLFKNGWSWRCLPATQGFFFVML